MFQRISNSWQLVKASAAVLRADKELIVFPIVSTVGVILVTASFLIPMVAGGVVDALSSGKTGNVTLLGLLITFVFYIVEYTVIIFANSALVGAALIRLKGGDPTLADGLRIALDHLGAILGYALISATVGMILRSGSNRRGTLARLAIAAVGMAWNLATFLVVPVLVTEGVGPIEAVKRSAQLLRKTWGEQIAGNFGIGAILALATVLVIIVIGGPVLVVGNYLQNAGVVVLGAAIVALALVILSLIGSTLNGIYTAAVYRYAVDGQTSGYFPEDLVRGAFQTR